MKRYEDSRRIGDGEETTAPLSRRRLLGAGSLGVAAALCPALIASSPAKALGRPPLILYFSKTGTTRAVAERIHDHVGGDLFELRVRDSYPENHQATVDRARAEQDAKARPALISDAIDTEAYGPVFVGYPNWWSTLPMAYFTFLERHTFAGKTLHPFCTHEGSRLGQGPSDLRRLCPQATVAEGLALRGGGVANVRTEAAVRDVAAWLRAAGFAG